MPSRMMQCRGPRLVQCPLLVVVAVATPQVDGSISWHPSLPYCSYGLSTCFLMFPAPWRDRDDGNVPFRTECPAITCPQHCDQSCLSWLKMNMVCFFEANSILQKKKNISVAPCAAFSSCISCCIPGFLCIVLHLK